MWLGGRHDVNKFRNNGLIGNRKLGKVIEDLFHQRQLKKLKGENEGSFVNCYISCQAPLKFQIFRLDIRSKTVAHRYIFK